MKTEKVEIGKKVYLVKELTLSQIRDITGKAGGDAAGPLIDLLQTCSDMTAEEISAHAPSEVRSLTDKIIEVNTDFFEQAGLIGMDKSGKQLERMMRSIFLIPFLSSSTPDTE